MCAVVLALKACRSASPRFRHFSRTAFEWELHIIVNRSLAPFEDISSAGRQISEGPDKGRIDGIRGSRKHTQGVSKVVDLLVVDWEEAVDPSHSLLDCIVAWDHGLRDWLLRLGVR